MLVQKTSKVLILKKNNGFFKTFEVLKTSKVDRSQRLDVDQRFSSAHFACRHPIHHFEAAAEIGRVLVAHFLAYGTDGFFGGAK